MSQRLPRPEGNNDGFLPGKRSAEKKREHLQFPSYLLEYSHFTFVFLDCCFSLHLIDPKQQHTIVTDLFKNERLDTLGNINTVSVKKRSRQSC